MRTLDVERKNGYGHAECLLAKPRQLGCDFIGLQGTWEIGEGKSFLQQGTGSSALGKRKRKADKDCAELGWQLRNRYTVSLLKSIN